MALYLPSGVTPGECDRCSRKVPLSELRSEIERGRDKGNSICSECWDQDHPQNWVGSRPIGDKQSVEGACPPPNLRYDRSLYGFDPVGALGGTILVSTGIVSIVIS